MAAKVAVSSAEAALVAEVLAVPAAEVEGVRVRGLPGSPTAPEDLLSARSPQNFSEPTRVRVFVAPGTSFAFQPVCRS